MKNSLLDLVNSFLKENSKPPVSYSDSLYFSGILDSLDILNLILFLENNKILLDKRALYQETLKIDLSMIDSVEQIECQIKQNK